MQSKSSQDILSQDTLKLAMGVLSSRFDVQVHALLDSTNTEAKRLAIDGTRYALISAEAQTAGRGRMGRSFYSPDTTGVYFSILYTFSAPIASAVTVTSAAAVAVMRAIKRVCGKQTAIKWVNDLYLHDKKVCGILAESVLDPSRPNEYPVIIGIGINLRNTNFPTELADIAGALGSDTSRAELIAAAVEELLPYLDNPDDRSWIDDYRRYSCILGREITWTRGAENRCGKAVGINEDGALLVELPNGERKALFTGEISVRAI